MNSSDIINPDIRFAFEHVVGWAFLWWIVLGLCVARVYTRKTRTLIKQGGSAYYLSRGIRNTAVGSATIRAFFGIFWLFVVIAGEGGRPNGSFAGQNIFMILPFCMFVVHGYLDHLYAHWAAVGRLWIYKPLEFTFAWGCPIVFILGWLR